MMYVVEIILEMKIIWFYENKFKSTKTLITIQKVYCIIQKSGFQKFKHVKVMKNKRNKSSNLG